MYKKNNDLRIIYMGTPDFAVPSLELLIAHQYNLVAVITAPDKPKGRGQQLSASPVKEVALKHNIPILQPTNLKNPKFIEELKSYRANLQIVVAFRMLPEVVWDMPELGTFNLHASLLPQYRGAAPINWVIINGEKQTGITTFFLQHQIDTGHIIFQEKEPITINDNVGSLYQRLMTKGATLVLKTVKTIESNNYSQLPQSYQGILKHAPKIFKETCEINWNQPSNMVYNFIRGLSPYPTAWCKINGTTYKIFNSDITNKSLPPGKIDTDNDTFLHIGTSDNALSINDIQKQGKKRIDILSFLRGNKL